MKTIVKGDYKSNLKINFSLGTWKIFSYTLFENQVQTKTKLPTNPSLYRLSIMYDDEHFYFENVLYVSNPNLDNLEFNFYTDANRIFCFIKSDIVTELNKEIVLGPLPESLQELKKILEVFNNGPSASL